jgi:hypothetical protein
MATRLYTIELLAKPVTVLSAGVELLLEDNMATKPKLIRSLRFTQNLEASLSDEMIERRERQEINEALDTRLGEDLCVRLGWSRDVSEINVQPAKPDEAEARRTSPAKAVQAGERDAGDEDFGVYLQ